MKVLLIDFKEFEKELDISKEIFSSGVVKIPTERNKK